MNEKIKKILPRIVGMAALFLIVMSLVGCEAKLGDSCSTSNDCPTGTVCDTDSPSGYCLVSGCDLDDECPDNSVCVAFTKEMHYCLKKCKKNSDCRSKYVCRDDIGTSKFCYVEPEYPYGRRDENQVEFSVTKTDNTVSQGNAGEEQGNAGEEQGNAGQENEQSSPEENPENP